jgi:hypothetical protein
MLQMFEKLLFFRFQIAGVTASNLQVSHRNCYGICSRRREVRVSITREVASEMDLDSFKLLELQKTSRILVGLDFTDANRREPIPDFVGGRGKKERLTCTLSISGVTADDVQEWRTDVCA